MDEAVKKLTATVLAGGKSRRFGQDKAFFQYQGKPLVLHACEIIEPYCDQLLVSTNKPAAYKSTGLKTISDIYRDCGPLGGIHSALVHARHDLVAFIPCDSPMLPGELYRYLLQRMEGRDLVLAAQSAGVESTCGIWHKKSLPRLERAIAQKKYKILDAIEGMDAGLVRVDTAPFYHPRIFHNINTRHDL